MFRLINELKTKISSNQVGVSDDWINDTNVAVPAQLQEKVMKTKSQHKKKEKARRPHRKYDDKNVQEQIAALQKYISDKDLSILEAEKNKQHIHGLLKTSKINNDERNDVPTWPQSSEPERKKDSIEKTWFEKSEENTGKRQSSNASFKVGKDLNLNQDFKHGLMAKKGTKRRIYNDTVDSIDDLEMKLRSNPKTYKRCSIMLRNPHYAICTVLNPTDNLTTIEIYGRSKCGRSFNNDEVLVEILMDKNDLKSTVYGRVIGTLRRSKYELDGNPSFLCTLDKYQMNLMKPLCKTVPKISIFHGNIQRNCPERKNYFVEVYDIKKDRPVFKRYHSIAPGKHESYLFLVAYFAWNPHYCYPLGAIIGVMEYERNFDGTLPLLDMINSVPTFYEQDTIDDVKETIEKFEQKQHEIDSSVKDMTQILKVFTIDPEGAQDLDDALSITTDPVTGNLEVGIHIADVSAVVIRHSPVDNEAMDRAVSFYSGNGRTMHMLPEPISAGTCSLVQGRKCRAVSTFMKFNASGKRIPECKPAFAKTWITSSHQLTYDQAQAIIEGAGSSELHQDVKTLNKIARHLRKYRLKNATFHVPLGYDLARDAHSLVEEFMVLTNTVVGQFLAKSCSQTIPLRCQEPPMETAIRSWFDEHSATVDSILRLQGISLFAGTEVSIENPQEHAAGNYTWLQASVWEKILEEKHLSEMEKVKILICQEENHPLQAIAIKCWYKIQNPALNKCSGAIDKEKKKHYSLNLSNYVNCTSPIRRYVDLVVQRLLVATIDKLKTSYSQSEVEDICFSSNIKVKNSKSYHRAVRTLKLVSQLQQQPLHVSGFVGSISESAVELVIPEIEFTPDRCSELLLSLLDLKSKPEINTNDATKKPYVELVWKKCLFDDTGYSSHSRSTYQQDTCQRLDPCLQTVPVSNNSWRQLLKSVMFDNDKLMRNNITRITSEPMSSRMSDNTVEDVTSEVKEGGKISKLACHFSQKLFKGQSLKVELSTDYFDGMIWPIISLYHVTPSVAVCLDHFRDPIRSFAKYGSKATQNRYPSWKIYNEIWQSLISMEAATGAIQHGDKVAINNIRVQFCARATEDSAVNGSFSILQTFCNDRNIELSIPDDFVQEQDENEERRVKEFVSDYSFDFLCIRCRIKSSDDSDSKYVTWTSHCNIFKMTRSKDVCQIFFRINHAAYDIPPSIVGTTQSCNVEIITKAKSDRRCHSVVSMLAKNDGNLKLAKSIAFGNEISSLSADYLDLVMRMPVDVEVDGLPRNNENQSAAIRNAMQSKFSIIQGPPGTGKTYTAIKLIYLFDDINKKLHDENGSIRNKILLCGPTNKSVDAIAKNVLKKLGAKAPRIVRVYGSAFVRKDFPIPGKFHKSNTMRHAKSDQELRAVTMHFIIRKPDKKHSDKLLGYDNKFQNSKDATMKEIKAYRALERKATEEELVNYDVIMTTCVVAGSPTIVNNNFFQCLIDESGMSYEPESMIPIAVNRVKQVTLIGDHKQLRPVILSKDAAKLGMDRSLFERYASKAQFLSEQYRMHPNICKFPSEEFYDGNLQTGGSRLWQDPPHLPFWPNADYPIAFCHVIGEEETLTVSTEDGNEASRSNEAERTHVVRIYGLIMKYLQKEGNKHPISHLNVMTQYNAQRHAIVDDLKEDGYIKANVNTVVGSQGGEWDFTILSTVRSLPWYKIEPNPSLGWCHNNLGFITDANQTNVALTRARKGLIIIGNKHLLRCSDVWRKLLNFYEKNGCIVDAGKFPVQRRH